MISPEYRDVMINQCQPGFKQQHNDKQGALLEKIMEKLTSFNAEDRTLKKFSPDLQSFQVRELYLHAVYFNSVLFSERVWHKDEIHFTLFELAITSDTGFIPQLERTVTFFTDYSWSPTASSSSTLSTTRGSTRQAPSRVSWDLKSLRAS